VLLLHVTPRVDVATAAAGRLLLRHMLAVRLPLMPLLMPLLLLACCCCCWGDAGRGPALPVRIRRGCWALRLLMRLLLLGGLLLLLLLLLLPLLLLCSRSSRRYAERAPALPVGVWRGVGF
jgi:hypothetical protein